MLILISFHGCLVTERVPGTLKGQKIVVHWKISQMNIVVKLCQPSLKSGWNWTELSSLDTLPSDGSVTWDKGSSSSSKVSLWDFVSLAPLKYTGLFVYASGTSLILEIFEVPGISWKWAVGPTVPHLELMAWKILISRVTHTPQDEVSASFPLKHFVLRKIRKCVNLSVGNTKHCLPPYWMVECWVSQWWQSLTCDSLFSFWLLIAWQDIACLRSCGTG